MFKFCILLCINISNILCWIIGFSTCRRLHCSFHYLIGMLLFNDSQPRGLPLGERYFYFSEKGIYLTRINKDDLIRLKIKINISNHCNNTNKLYPIHLFYKM